jgi:hypothetical protein
VLKLSKQFASPVLGISDGYFLDQSASIMRLQGYGNVLPAFCRLENPVPFDPTVSNELHIIKENEFVCILNEAVISQIWEEIGLHDA